ncbi:hypothetical protein DFH08DRAFT_1026332 [Mycena albidolilacea]|uniref:Uncharacterized protein n=1 Tax=Mycena albidolilacea TaxID=1033008 RepID=A0AAD6ZK61_9AGAR|nr:hypothetical protein DFH08DRAFT_1026332 [Mycena albidolilacea]
MLTIRRALSAGLWIRRPTDDRGNGVNLVSDKSLILDICCTTPPPRRMSTKNNARISGAVPRVKSFPLLENILKPSTHPWDTALDTTVMVQENSRPEGKWALFLNAFLSPSPGRTLDQVYTAAGKVLETQANRVAYKLGLGPHVIARKIKSYFGDSDAKQRVQLLELLQTTVPSKLKKLPLRGPWCARGVAAERDRSEGGHSPPRSADMLTYGSTEPSNFQLHSWYSNCRDTYSPDTGLPAGDRAGEVQQRSATIITADSVVAPRLSARHGGAAQQTVPRNILNAVLFLQTKVLDNTTSPDAMSKLWNRAIGPPDPEWTFWQILVATCLADTTISAILEIGQNCISARDLRVTVLETYQILQGEDDPHTLQAMTPLGVTQYALGEYKKAEEVLELALEKQRKILGENHPETVWQHGLDSFRSAPRQSDKRDWRLYLTLWDVRTPHVAWGIWAFVRASLPAKIVAEKPCFSGINNQDFGVFAQH